MIYQKSNKLFSLSTQTLLATSTALVTVVFTGMATAQECKLTDGTIGEACDHANQGTVVLVPSQANTEYEDVLDVDVDGFEISVDGHPVTQDGSIQKGATIGGAELRRQDIDLAEANVSVKFDGLDVQPRLDVETVGDQTEYKSGDRVTFRNYMNYPYFIRKGEIRIIDRAVRGGEKTVAVLPLVPNGTVTTTVPEGEGLVYVYRVYDAKGRFDETAPASLIAKSRRGLEDGVEEGTDTALIRRIPVSGGAVTVSGQNVRNGASVSTLGEVIRPDADGDFVIQRILPSGEHTVDVDIAGGPSLVRDIDIPKHDLFFIGLADITLGKTDNEQTQASGTEDDTFARGRLAFYLKGKLKGGYTLTAAADSGEEELSNLVSNLDEKDPNSILERLDNSEYFPVYGDDSTSEIDAPTSGKLYVKLEKEDSFGLWGNFKSHITETEYLRNERTLYGAQIVYKSPEQTGKGLPKLEFEGFAAQPDSLPQRDVFRGTGGSTYFLRFQDITRGSETLLIEIVNPTTGQVISRRTLIYGTDYDINYTQGLVILSAPLSGSGAGGDLINENPNGDDEAFLVVNYDHTPTLANIDTFSYGARIQTWVTDDLRIGGTYQSEDLGVEQQDAYGFDILYQKTDRTYFELEYALTDGLGRDEDRSVDGGLTLITDVGVAGSGEALRFKGQVDLEDLGAPIPGVIGGYIEERTAGFSTLNYRAETDESLWGFYADIDPTERSSLRFYYDSFDDEAGRHLREGGVEYSFQKTDAWSWDVGVEHVDENRVGAPDQSGERTDVALRLTYDPSDLYTLYGYVQGTVNHSGGIERNNRIGFGGDYKISDAWRATAEISDGSTGTGARALIEYDPNDKSSYYFGYTLEPDRDFGGVDLNGTDKGNFVIGARRTVNENLTIYAENTYDLFGEHKALTSHYGADYTLDDFWALTGGLEVGRITDPTSTSISDFDRRAISFGISYKDEDLSARTVLEYRRDDGFISGADRTADTIAATITTRYKINETSRLLFNFEGIRSSNATDSIPDAKYLETTLGYAYRPIDNDRFNMLARYTYLFDMTERSTTLPASGSNFLNTPRQRSHVFNIDASYDLNRYFTLGGKIGGRFSAQDTGSGFVSNNATLAVVNLRYHVVHNWDALLEARQLTAQASGTDKGVLAAAYRHVGNNLKIGVGYNFSQFSDDLTDVVFNDRGLFVNVVGKF